MSLSDNRQTVPITQRPQGLHHVGTTGTPGSGGDSGNPPVETRQGAPSPPHVSVPASTFGAKQRDRYVHSSEQVIRELT
jgi:hypothetical protein